MGMCKAFGNADTANKAPPNCMCTTDCQRWHTVPQICPSNIGSVMDKMSDSDSDQCKLSVPVATTPGSPSGQKPRRVGGQ